MVVHAGATVAATPSIVISSRSTYRGDLSTAELQWKVLFGANENEPAVVLVNSGVAFAAAVGSGGGGGRGGSVDGVEDAAFARGLMCTGAAAGLLEALELELELELDALLHAWPRPCFGCALLRGPRLLADRSSSWNVMTVARRRQTTAAIDAATAQMPATTAMTKNVLGWVGRDVKAAGMVVTAAPSVGGVVVVVGAVEVVGCAVVTFGAHVPTTLPDTRVYGVLTVDSVAVVAIWRASGSSMLLPLPLPSSPTTTFARMCIVSTVKRIS